jgi:ABC-type branched-subunit amino acid transport system ATPase component
MLEVNRISLLVEAKEQLDNLSLELQTGESCTIRCQNSNLGHAFLLSLLGSHPTISGKIIFNNQQIINNSANTILLAPKKIGFASECTHFFELFSIVDNIALTASYHNSLSKQELSNRILNIIHLLNIENIIDTPVNELPKTTQLLLIIARELVRQPELLLIDYLLDQLTEEDRILADQAIFSLCDNQLMSVISFTYNQTLLVASKNYELRKNCIQTLIG